MALAAKKVDGSIINTPFPNGYQYVGNSQYGRWRENDSGGSMWEFYGKYMLMSQVMNWAGFGLGRNHYNDYNSFNRSGRPYYGPKREYGTSGTVTKKQKPDFFRRKMAKNTRSRTRFQDKVGRRMGRSKNTFRSRGLDGETIKLGNLNIEVLSTPGHTAGGVSYKIHDSVFSGDAIFAGSMGRANSSTGLANVVCSSQQL